MGVEVSDPEVGKSGGRRDGVLGPGVPDPKTRDLRKERRDTDSEIVDDGV